MNRVEVRECISNLKINGQKGIHTEYKDLCPQISKLSAACAYQYYSGISSMNQLLIRELGFSKATASELLKVVRIFYTQDGIINPCFKGYDYSKLVKMASCKDISYLEKLHKMRFINETMTREEIVERL